MKYLRLALIVVASALSLARAQEANQDEERHAPPIEIPDFSNLDEYIYEPRSTVTLAYRFLSGAKTSFSGHGSILSADYVGDATTPNLVRTYHDGQVRPDARNTSRTDTSGNGFIDPAGTTTAPDPVPPDGKTNNWTFSDARQVGPDVPNGFVAFHSYSAAVTDDTVRTQNSKSNSGLDLAMARDMGKVWKGKITWKLLGGISVNDISSKTTAAVKADLRTIRDLYSLYGQKVPDATVQALAPSLPYISPSAGTQTVYDASGNAVTNSDGTLQTVPVDTSILISNAPVNRSDVTVSNGTAVVDQWHIKGSYVTLRGGPQLMIPITARFHAELSAGFVLVYAGTSYSVTQTFTPEIGDDLVEVDTNTVYRWRPGYFADASLQFDLTDKAGFFAGAVYQSAGSYTQNLDTSTAKYATKVDLSNENGVRAGMSIRF